MGSIPPPKSERKPLHQAIPPLILGTATFNSQYVSDPFNPEILPALSIVSRTLELGINAFDTSPYYGPSETILGDALAHPVNAKYPRSSYFLVTKAGRIGGNEFDYSPSWVRYSVYRSLERLHTTYLDLVYMHDVEFMSPAEVLGAVGELRRLRDEGVIRYVGISGYPVSKLCDLAELVQAESGESLDAVLSYSHFTIQNTTLSTSAVKRFTAAGVDVVLNASMLGMGLLTTRGADAGPTAAWHPSPGELRGKVKQLVSVAKEADEKLEVVSIRWALDNWSRDGASLGGTSSRLPEGTRVGVSVMGVASVPELEETERVFHSVVEGLNIKPSSPEVAEAHAWSLQRRKKIQGLVEKMWAVLGEWKDYSWDSPEPGFVNTRRTEDFGIVPDDGVMARHQGSK
ncbi:Aldo/keto reductase family-domain-containing protein [Pseudomassariella vexata]|uniref:Aldo/keto reductase family-domain-containing protein n=1 Tax=Pseudomassariella vexata TaxID=1141098 RepID=A0A1Y2DX44_9PEZI|nr:Aldo/keto reductase family-domain-containing protein [Pseudomassariella vexata]ORY63872.1 Aldo/keto reductase family-domain-containing protein [Pseudomassariella vexata]